MVRIVFLGPPGSGKGTYATRIAPELGIPHISSSGIFKDAEKAGLEMGKKAMEYIRQGKPVPDEIAIAAIIERLTQPDCKNGFIFDCPYNVYQAKKLDENPQTKIDLAVSFVWPKEILLEKLSARRVCENCYNIYNIANIQREIEGVKYNLPPISPKVEGICDKCGGKLVQRPDDRMEAVKVRFEEYQKRGQPLVDYYKERGILIEIRPTAEPKIMVPKILEAIRKFMSERGIK